MPRAVLLGHLTITVPTVVAAALVAYYGWYMFGPEIVPYYAAAGVWAGWQWYSIALPRWSQWLKSRGVGEAETKEIGQRAGLVWPGASAIGLFALHTAVASICAIHLGPRLVSRWFAWILPLTGFSTITPPADYLLQHLELVSIVPAFAVGYLMSHYFQRLATWAWVVPSVILTSHLITFTDVHSSVLVPSSSWGSRFSYFFVIQQTMPTFQDLRGSDPVRVALQMTVVAPFYSGVAYSIAALCAKHHLWRRLKAGSVAMESEPEPSQSSDAVSCELKTSSRQLD